MARNSIERWIALVSGFAGLIVVAFSLALFVPFYWMSLTAYYIVYDFPEAILCQRDIVHFFKPANATMHISPLDLTLEVQNSYPLLTFCLFIVTGIAVLVSLRKLNFNTPVYCIVLSIVVFIFDRAWVMLPSWSVYERIAQVILNGIILGACLHCFFPKRSLL